VLFLSALVGLEEVVLEVKSENVAARSLYERAGFRMIEDGELVRMARSVIGFDHQIDAP
jgi:ribosomal protein S18 acetylase RimI-like enzyme